MVLKKFTFDQVKNNQPPPKDEKLTLAAITKMKELFSTVISSAITELPKKASK